MAETEFVFREDGYARSIEARVLAVEPDGGPDGGIVLDRTVFYAASGGQPGDTGTLTGPGGIAVRIANTVHPDGDKTRIVHLPAPGEPALAPGDAVMAVLDWDRRYRLMRMHTALHLLCVALPFPVTGGSVGEERGRLDFDMPETPEDIVELDAELNRLVEADYPVTAEWITDAEMAERSDLIKTMKVGPPLGQGRVRLVRIGTQDNTIDLQPCGGTHVRRTGEIGRLRIGRIEKKGRQNRRVNLHFADA